MPLLLFLRQSAHWLFLGWSIAFLVFSLLFQLPEPPQMLSFIHPFALYALVMSLILYGSCSVTLWVCRAQENESLTTVLLTLGATLLVGGMIAALLFFL